MFNLTRSLFGALVICIAMIFVGCSGSDSGSSTANTEDSGKVVQYCSAEPKVLNPYTRTDANANILIRRTFQPLVMLDFFSYELVPVLATALPVTEVQENGKVHLGMEIRPEAKWDNGGSITAEDVAFSVKMMKNPFVDNRALKPYFEYIEDVVVDESNNRKFTLVCKEPYMLMESALTDLLIIPSYIYDPDGVMKNYAVSQLENDKEALADDAVLKKAGDDFNAPKFQREVVIGSGAYTLDRWETNQRLVYTLKEDWWGHALAEENHWFQAKAPEIIYEVINDQTTAVVALKGEKIDAMYRIDPRTFMEELKKSESFNEKFNTASPTQFLYSYLGMNMRAEKFKDVRTRKALRSVMDVKKYGNTVFYGLAERVNSFIHPSKKQFINPDIPFYDQNLDEARRLLAEAGWSDSNGNGTLDMMIEGELTEFNIELIYPNAAQTSEKGVLMFKEFAKNVGINVEPRPLDFSVFLDQTKNHNFEMYFGIWGSSPLESDPKQIWHTSSYNGGSNYVGFGTPRSDELIDNLRRELDIEKRSDIYHELQQIIDEECPYIFMDATQNRIAISKKFTNTNTSGVNPGFYTPGFTSVNVVAN
ncbi:MAG: ABC transporter substrate-binding protein [Bacteroidota bacterium]